MKRKGLVLIALLFLASTVLFAQASDEASSRTSRSLTNTQTNFLFDEDVDIATDVTRIPDIETGLIWLTLNDTNFLKAGFSTFIGPVYGSFYYEGDVLRTTENSDEDITTDPILDGDNDISATDEKSNPTENKEEDSANFFDLTLGFGSIGVGLTLDQFAVVREDNDSGGADDGYDRETAADGELVRETVRSDSQTDTVKTLEPGIRVGFQLPLGGLTLRPHVGTHVNLRTDENHTEDSTLVREPGSGYPDYDGTTDVVSYDYEATQENDNYIAIKPFAGVEAEAGDWQFGVGYDLELRLYDNEYTDASGSSQSVEGTAESTETVGYATVSGITDGTEETTEYDYTAVEKTYTEHNVTPYVEYTKDVDDRFSYGVGFFTKVTIRETTDSESGGSEETVVRVSPDGDVSNDFTRVTTIMEKGREYELSLLTVNPGFNGALQYQIVPGTLRLNGGASLGVPNIYTQYQETTRPGIATERTVTTFGDGRVTESVVNNIGDKYNETSKYDFEVQDLSVLVSAGLTWTMTDAVSLDLSMSNPGATTVNATTFQAQLVVRQ